MAFANRTVPAKERNHGGRGIDDAISVEAGDKNKFDENYQPNRRRAEGEETVRSGCRLSAIAASYAGVLNQDDN